MNPSLPALADYPVHVPTRSVNPPTRAADVRRPCRAWSERLRKPASWLALGAIALSWTSLASVTRPALVLSAEALGLLAVVVAMLGRIWCALYIAGRKNAELCQDGPYSLVRNPLYVFSFVGALGVALATHRPLLVPVVAALFIAYYHIVIRAEETRLAGLFPADYPAYRRTVPRGLPRLSGYRSRARLTLDPADVARAMREVVWFAFAFAAAIALGRIA